MKTIFRPFFGSSKWRLPAYGIGLTIVALICMNVWGAWRLTYVMADFGYALQNSATREQYVTLCLWVFGIRMLFIATDIAVHDFLKPIYAWFWYEALSRWYLGKWHGRLSEIEGASQRIHASTREVATLITDLSITVLRKLIGLLAFIYLLWELSKHFQFVVPIPGILLWAVIVLSVVETLVSQWLGKNIPLLERKRQRTDASYRTNLEIIQRHRVEHGPKHHERRLVVRARRSIVPVRWRTVILVVQRLPLSAWRNLSGSLWGEGLMMFLGFFVAVLIVFPYGVMMQTVAVLGEAHSSLSIFSERWSDITTIQGSIQRLQEFEHENQMHTHPHHH